VIPDRHRGTIRAATHAPPDLRPLRLGNQGLVPASVLSQHAAETLPRRMILLLGTVLFVALGVIALFFAVVFETPAATLSAPGAVNEAIARQFYAAVNDAVRTGDLSLLDQVAMTDNDDLSDVKGPGCDLRCRVSALHQLDPDLHLAIDDVLVDEDRVAVHLSIQGNDRPVFLGLPLRGNLAPWAQVDLLRVADGQIVEMQGAGERPTLVEPLGRTTLEAVPPAPYRLGLVRLTVEPSTAIPALSAEGPMFLLVESGALVVHVDRPSQVQAPGRAGDPVRDELRAAGDILLSPGERIALVAHTGYALRSTGNEAAVVLSAAALAGDGGSTNRWVRARSFDEILFNPTESDVEAQVSAPTPWPPGVRSELLAYGIIASRPAESATLALTRLTLSSSVALPVHETLGAELLAVETGAAIVDLVTGDGAVRLKMGAYLRKISPQGARSAHDRLVSPRGSAVLQPGASAGVRNVDEEPLVLLILTLEPEPAVR
jgi:predicted ester cyclase